MPDYQIFANSTVDITAEMAQSLELEIIPLALTMGGQTFKNYLDGRDISNEDFYERIRQGERATTTQSSPGDFIDAFRPHLEAGKDILYIAFSSGLSGTYSTSLIARDQLQEEFPEAKIYCLDSLSASMGEGLLVWHACQRKKAGASIDEVRDWVEDNKLHLCHWFTVDDLMYLHKGGRCSAATAFAGSLLNIKPVLHVDNEGKLIPMDKVRNHKKAQAALVEKMAAAIENPDGQTVFISHSHNPEGAEYVASLIRERFHITEIHINYIGPVIGAHVGIGTVALFFLGFPR